jgi:hypothetical protein
MENRSKSRSSKSPTKPFPVDRMGRGLAHQQSAEDLLQRSERAGLFDLLTDKRLATIATAHATLALSYVMSSAELDAQSTTEASSAGSAHEPGAAS